MSVNFELNAELRHTKGKGASRRLRCEGKVPGILYGAGKDPVSITLSQRQLLKSLENEAVYSHILTLNIDGKFDKVVLRDLHRHPVKPIVLHVDLLRVSETTKIRLSVPLHFINQDIAPGVKVGGGLVSHLMNSIELSCLAKDLPEFIEVDLAGLELNHSLHLSDLKLPEGVEIPALMQGPEHDLPVVNIHLTRASESEAPVVGAAAPAAAVK